MAEEITLEARPMKRTALALHGDELHRGDKRLRYDNDMEFQAGPLTGKRELQHPTASVKVETHLEGIVAPLPLAPRARRAVPAGESWSPVPAIATAGRLHCLQAVYFHPVSSAADLVKPTICFSPLFVHHFFGTKEEIYGFSELLVRIFYAVDSLEMWIHVDAVRASAGSLAGGGQLSVALGQGGKTDALSDVVAAGTGATSAFLTDGDIQDVHTTRMPQNSGTSHDGAAEELKVDGLLPASPMQCTTLFSTKDDVDGPTSASRQATTTDQASLERILGYLSKVPIPGSHFHRNSVSFVQEAIDKSRTFHPPGVLVNTFVRGSGEHEEKFELYRCRFDGPPGSQSYTEAYHRRVEWFLHFFIDSCSSIEYDNRWDVLLLFRNRSCLGGAAEQDQQADGDTDATPSSGADRRLESELKKDNSSQLPDPNVEEGVSQRESTKGVVAFQPGYEIAGVTTLYTFFALPLCRRRISQFMILPYFQGRGLGLEMLQRVYCDAMQDSNIGEITVEDPAPAFVQLRDVVGIRILIQKGVLSKEALMKGNGSVFDSAHEKDREALTTLRRKIREATKECPMQIRRLAEIVELGMILPQTLDVLKSESVVKNKQEDCKVEANGMKREDSGASKVSRDWRQTKELKNEQKTATETDTGFHLSDRIRPLRIRCKKRLRLENIEALGSLPASEQRADLVNRWKRTYDSYLRTLLKIRADIVAGRV